MQRQLVVATIAGRHIGHLAGLGGIGDEHRFAGGIHREVDVGIHQDGFTGRILVAQLNDDPVRAVWLEYDAIRLFGSLISVAKT